LPINWNTLHNTTHTQHTPLPTYPFQHQKYWLNNAIEGSGTRHNGTGHPFIDHITHLAGADELVLTGDISMDAYPWLSDHTVAQIPLLPSTAFIDIALEAAQQADLDGITELAIEAPLPLSASTALQVRLGAPDDNGERAIAVYARCGDEPWKRHATGRAGSCLPDGGRILPWPSPDATPMEVTDLYKRMAAIGMGYGPSFQGLRRAWQDGDTICAEVAITEEIADVGRLGFTVHPALLDAALHTMALHPTTAYDERTIKLPFTLSGVSLFNTKPTALRVWLTPTSAETVSLHVADSSGHPVLTVDELRIRAIDVDRLGESDPASRAMYELDWVSHRLSSTPTVPSTAS
ncbi:polyketide synthase dehydratase domain-containing protein, partial [Nocardia amikacinitolerans]|uniref:polyketide synthase dehydratase domain-containing protein n=1 Tax=Nocardia amikacinitolerans TaxID=756689 RepID=UPI0020A5A15F